MNNVTTTIFGLFGGLALFLYGMNSMSEALQKVAGERMKTVLGFLTKNPLMGAAAGALITAILQSSSATTVMVIGFVSSGLMGLPQAISVIFGANIGTTMTAQLIAFDISDYIYPVIFTGFIIQFLAKREKMKNTAMVIFSFGLLFLGIEIMSSVMKPLAASPVFTMLMGKVADIPVLGVLLGLCMTLLVQSSSATIAVLQSFAAQPGADGIHSAIGLAGAIPILLGDNIGTTITALLASIGQSRNAKRTAIAHSCFNISGSILFVMIIPWFSEFIARVSPKGEELVIISRQIANAHTAFNVVMTVIWLPLLPLMVKLVMTLIPGTDRNEETSARILYLDPKLIAQPAPALLLVSQEIEHCISSIRSLFTALKQELEGSEGDREQPGFENIYTGTKSVQKEIMVYLSKMFSAGVLSGKQTEKASGFLTVVNDIDRVADRCADIVELQKKIFSTGKSLSIDATVELEACVEAVREIFEKSAAMLRDGGLDEARSIAENREQLRKLEKQFNNAHLLRVKAGECAEELTPVYMGILYNIDRIADNCISITEESLHEVRLTEPEEIGILAG